MQGRLVLLCSARRHPLQLHAQNHSLTFKVERDVECTQPSAFINHCQQVLNLRCDDISLGWNELKGFEQENLKGNRCLNLQLLTRLKTTRRLDFHWHTHTYPSCADRGTEITGDHVLLPVTARLKYMTKRWKPKKQKVVIKRHKVPEPVRRETEVRLFPATGNAVQVTPAEHQHVVAPVRRLTLAFRLESWEANVSWSSHLMFSLTV